MRSARQRLKMKIFVTVLIFWFSEYYDITTFQNRMGRAQSTGLIFSLSLEILTDDDEENDGVTEDGEEDEEGEAEAPERGQPVTHHGTLRLLVRTSGEVLDLT